jgi:8-oxo-dGTP diphosphatase
MTLPNEPQLQEEARRQGIKRFVAAAVVLSGSKVLVLERQKGDFMEGMYELPSGKLEDSELPSTALQRELEEETGLKLAAIKKFLGYFDYISSNGETTRQFNYLVTVERADDVQLSEHESYVWVEKGQLDKYNISEEVKNVLKSIKEFDE